MLRSFIRNQKGNSLVEFAVTMPLAMVLCFAAGDFGRMFTEAAILAGAVNAGAIYGYRNVNYSADDPAIQSAILTDSAQLSGVTADSDQLCDCPNAPGVWISCNDTMCTDYGKPRVYLRASATKPFATLGLYPDIPSQVTISTAAYMRVQ
jgi:Flp pilus assembly protein TadG